MDHLRKPLKTLLFALATAFISPSFAFAKSQLDLAPSEFDLHQAAHASKYFGQNHRNVAAIKQTGTSMDASITQHGADLSAVIYQQGAYNEALILQQGYGHRAQISQFGHNNQASIEQSGATNSASIVQFGSDKTSSIIQSGQLVDVLVRQYR